MSPGRGLRLDRLGPIRKLLHDEQAPNSNLGEAWNDKGPSPHPICLALTAPGSNGSRGGSYRDRDRHRQAEWGWQ